MRSTLVLVTAIGCTPCGSEAVRQANGDCALIVTPDGVVATPDEDSGAEPSFERGVTRVASRRVECLPDEGWLASADAAPDPGSATLDVVGPFEADERLEHHGMAFTDAPHWQFSANLAVVPVASQQAGVSTAFACDVVDALTWRLHVWDASGRWSDCRVWGAHPTRFTDERCIEW